MDCIREPSREECWCLLTMLESSLIRAREVHLWLDALILALDPVPVWVCDLALKSTEHEMMQVVHDWVNKQPFEPSPSYLNKFFVVCLWLRYQRGGLSWRNFLKSTGDFVDGEGGVGWDCEMPYALLTRYENSGFSSDVEVETRNRFWWESELDSEYAHACALFASFTQEKKLNEG